MRYGAIVFDAAVEQRRMRRRGETPVVEAREGWASVEGTEPFRIRKTADLPTDVVWITNLDMQSYVKNQLNRSPNFVPRHFMKSEFNQIAAEIGAHTEHEHVSVLARSLSDVFARVMRLCQKHFGVGHISTENRKRKLEYVIAESLRRKTQPMDAALNGAMEQAHQSRTTVVGQTIPYEWWQCQLRRNRYVNAYDVLDMPVPGANNWEYLDKSMLPAGDKAKIDWVVQNPLPVLVNAKIADGRGVEALITSFGGKRGNNVTKEWMSGPELYWVSKYYSTIDINAVYICNDGYVSMDELGKFPKPTPFTLSSLSMGLLCENFLAVMEEPYETPAGAFIYYPHSVWYSTMDRFFLFTMATRLVKASSYGRPNAGFRVQSYGLGNIQIAAPHEMIDELTDMAAQVGLEVPSSAYWKRTVNYRKHEGVMA